jgi:ABC-type sulfate transport system permease component
MDHRRSKCSRNPSADPVPGHQGIYSRQPVLGSDDQPKHYDDPMADGIACRGGDRRLHSIGSASRLADCTHRPAFQTGLGGADNPASGHPKLCRCISFCCFPWSARDTVHLVDRNNRHFRSTFHLRFPGAFLVLTILSYPYILLSIRAALQGMDPALEEAARSLGCSPWRTFWRVTIPQLFPAITAGGLLVALYVLRDFGAVSILRYDTFTRVIYIQYQSSFDRSAAALLSLFLIVMTLGILAFDRWSRGRMRYHRSPSGGTRPHPIVRLGRWRWPALLLCGSVVIMGLIIPAGVLIYWLARGIAAGEQIASIWPAARNSLLVSAMAAGAALLAALPFVILSVRRPGP